MEDQKKVSPRRSFWNWIGASMDSGNEDVDEGLDKGLKHEPSVVDIEYLHH